MATGSNTTTDEVKKFDVNSFGEQMRKFTASLILAKVLDIAGDIGNIPKEGYQLVRELSIEILSDDTADELTKTAALLTGEMLEHLIAINDIIEREESIEVSKKIMSRREHKK